MRTYRDPSEEKSSQGRLRAQLLETIGSPEAALQDRLAKKGLRVHPQKNLEEVQAQPVVAY